jgi:serine/threonine protein kinase
MQTNSWDNLLLDQWRRAQLVILLKQSMLLLAGCSGALLVTFGVLHAGTSTDNLLLDQRGHVKLSDFGRCVLPFLPADTYILLLLLLLRINWSHAGTSSLTTCC